MSTSNPRLLVTGANGQLGTLVIQALLRQCPASQIIATARDPHALVDIAALGVGTRRLDYNDASSLRHAFDGVDRVLLISSSALGQRIEQHRAVITAAQHAGVQLFAYTSVLHAPTLPHPILKNEHSATEADLRQSGIPYVILRNGWYTENYTANIPAILAHGAVVGCANHGRISGATRADYAQAAANVLISADPQTNTVYELAGDTAFTLEQLAAEIAQQSGKPIVYRNVSEAEYTAILQQAGLPANVAQFIAQSDTTATQNGLLDDSLTLQRLIHRPTTPLHDAVATALAHVGA